MGNTVLLVEDEETLCEEISKYLQSRGYEVLACFDGQEAINSIKNVKYDILVTDMGLPKASGHDVMKESRKINPSVSVILASGYYQPGLEKLGCDDFCHKPYNLKELEIMIKKHLDKS